MTKMQVDALNAYIAITQMRLACANRSANNARHTTKSMENACPATLDINWPVAAAL